MIRRVLIANRGEIAVRVIRACRDLGIETVAVYSQADATSAHVGMADRAVCIGPAPARDSYLNQGAVVAAALGTGADAIHPGYGFLSENADFAALCEREGLTFVGPSAETIRRSGDKVVARSVATQAGVPVVPGSDGAVADPHEADRLARSFGMPVLLKARAGGGGRGMRIVRETGEVIVAFTEASGEAAAAFGDGGLYVERYLDDVRHVEIQIMADRHGTTLALGERDCSVQRRHQKLVEESPSPAIDSQMRARISAAAVAAARSMQYAGAGTVEFLYAPASREFFFIEINARIQVEHPVTEMVTGADLVREQLLVAAGERLSWREEELAFTGHAIECRINAEDPSRNFMPSPGTLGIYRVPGGPGVRVDSHCYQGYTFPPNYDSLMAKLIVHGADREQARRRMLRALREFTIEGVATTIPFHQRLLDDPRFVSGNVNTQFAMV